MFWLERGCRAAWTLTSALVQFSRREASAGRFVYLYLYSARTDRCVPHGKNLLSREEKTACPFDVNSAVFWKEERETKTSSASLMWKLSFLIKVKMNKTMLDKDKKMFRY